MSLLERLERVVGRLPVSTSSSLLVGGCVPPLLVTDPAAFRPRPTLDIDVVVEGVDDMADWESLKRQLRATGFVEVAEEDAPLCRWRLDSELVDVVPVRAGPWGATNPWYETAVQHPLALDTSIRVIDAPHFVATKLAAFASRGAGNLAHHDVEDIIAVIDGRPELMEEFAASPASLRTTVGSELSGLLGTSRELLIDTVSMHLQPDPASQARAELIVERLLHLMCA